MLFSLAFPAFIAGFLMFLAPCTLPLVPGYLGFISGVSLHDSMKRGKIDLSVRRTVLLNALFYILGFSLVFILLGTLLSGLAQAGLGDYRFYLEKISGFLIFLLGLYMTHIFDLPFFRFLIKDRHFAFTQRLAPGKPLSSFLFGATFALGWSPCIGPILGSILLLASTTGTVLQGAILLAIFSLGLAVPFFLVALGIGQASRVIHHFTKYLSVISIAGGAFIALLGLLVLTGNLGVWTKIFYQLSHVIQYDRLLNFY